MFVFEASEFSTQTKSLDISWRKMLQESRSICQEKEWTTPTSNRIERQKRLHL